MFRACGIPPYASTNACTLLASHCSSTAVLSPYLCVYQVRIRTTNGEARKSLDSRIYYIYMRGTSNLGDDKVLPKLILYWS